VSDKLLAPTHRPAAFHPVGVLRATLGRLGRFCDGLDDLLARVARTRLGRRIWLVSWHRGPGRRWTARLSGPGVDRTVERSGLTRCGAVVRASLALSHLQKRIAPASRPRPPGQTPPILPL